MTMPARRLVSAEAGACSGWRSCSPGMTGAISRRSCPTIWAIRCMRRSAVAAALIASLELARQGADRAASRRHRSPRSWSGGAHERARSPSMCWRRCCSPRPSRSDEAALQAQLGERPHRRAAGRAAAGLCRARRPPGAAWAAPGRSARRLRWRRCCSALGCRRASCRARRWRRWRSIAYQQPVTRAEIEAVRGRGAGAGDARHPGRGRAGSRPRAGARRPGARSPGSPPRPSSTISPWLRSTTCRGSTSWKALPCSIRRAMRDDAVMIDTLIATPPAAAASAQDGFRSPTCRTGSVERRVVDHVQLEVAPGRGALPGRAIRLRQDHHAAADCRARDPAGRAYRAEWPGPGRACGTACHPSAAGSG